METIIVVALQRQMYGRNMYDPGQEFECTDEEANALEAMDMVRRKTEPDKAEPKKKRGQYDTRVMRPQD